MIKGLGFGKSLKQLFIIGLISCFTLLVGSSVNAWTYTGTTDGVENNWLIYQPVGDREYFRNYGLLVDSDSDFDTFYNTGDSQLVLYFPFDGNVYHYGNVYYGWIDEKLYYYGDYNTSKVYKTQGFIQNFCKTTKDLLFDKLNGPYATCEYNLPAEEFYSQSHNFVNIYSMSSNASDNAFITSTFRTFCLEESNGVDVYCWSCSMYNNQNQTWGFPCNSGLTGSLNFDIDVSDFSTVSDIPWSFSPWGGTSSGVINPVISGNLVESQPYTNGEIVKGFECAGLQPALCYGGFPINNIFEPSEQFEDFTGYVVGQGATVFDLYNLYSGSFSSLNQFLKTVLSRYKNGQINSFKTEPKALLMLGAQMNTAGINVDYISEYCTLLLNENSTDVYTGNSPGSLRARQCLRSEKTKDSFKNGSGLDVDFITTTGGIFGDSDDIDFDPDTFFSSIMDRITTGLDKNLSGGVVGLIPGYIIIFTLALIFIRIISH